MTIHNIMFTLHSRLPTKAATQETGSGSGEREILSLVNLMEFDASPVCNISFCTGSIFAQPYQDGEVCMEFGQICEGTEKGGEKHMFHLRTAGLLAVALVATEQEGLGAKWCMGIPGFQTE